MASDVSEVEGSVVAHVVIVGFHAQLGNRIEFAYPRLRGDPILRSPKISDTSDISASPLSPSVSPRPIISAVPSDDISSFLTPTSQLRSFPSDASGKLSPASGSARKGDWGELPDEWAFLPFMALPEGVHDQKQDIVFFKLFPDVHCVSCFRQADAIESVTHSASSGRSYERSVAARGSVQKSVVLLCRRPLYGVLADRLVPAVRRYFEQGDFARTDVLASLFHSVNASLSRPSLNTAETLFHGLDLRILIRRLGPQALAVLKLILLEKRVIFYSQPVSQASNACIAFASIFPGALDSIAPIMTPLDSSKNAGDYGLPLALFGPRDCVALEPYAPLPHIAELLPKRNARGCLIGTSHNVGMLLSSAATSAARKAAAAAAATNQPSLAAQIFSTPPRQSKRSTYITAEDTPPPLPKAGSRINGVADHTKRMSMSRMVASTAVLDHTPKQPSRHRHSMPPLPTQPLTKAPPTSSPPAKSQHSGTPSKPGVPIVDALVNLSTGKVSVSGSLEPLCRITREERRFMRDLMYAAAGSSASVSSSGSTGTFVGSDDYIRDRLRAYLYCLLGSVATIPGVLGGPSRKETWSTEDIDEMNLAPLMGYNEQFVWAWLHTSNAACWAKHCSPKIARLRPPPSPETEESSLEESFLPVDSLAAGFSGLRQNVAELSSIFSSKAAEGISSLFKRVEVEVGRVDSAVDSGGSDSVGATTPNRRLVNGAGKSTSDGIQSGGVSPSRTPLKPESKLSIKHSKSAAPQ